MNKTTLAFFALASLGSVAAHAADRLPPPCISGICVGQSLRDIAGRNWIDESQQFWMPVPQSDFKNSPVDVGTLALLNKNPGYAFFGGQFAEIRSPGAIPIILNAHFCAAYGFLLKTPDEHGREIKLTVLPVFYKGAVELRVIDIWKTINEPLITGDQAHQREEAFNREYGKYHSLKGPYIAQINGEGLASVHLSYNVNQDDLINSQTSKIRSQPGCAQASTAF